MKNEEHEYSKVQWFFMVIFIPVVFAIILFSVVLSFMGVDVVNKAKEVASNVPFVSEYVKTDEQILEEEEKASIEELTAKANEREIEIEKLNQTIASKDKEINELLTKIEELNAKLLEKEKSGSQTNQDYQEIAKLYETMSAKNAANILSQLPENEAASHLSLIKASAKAAILEKMSPEKAAQLLSLVSAN